MVSPFLAAGRAVTVTALASVAALVTACTSSSSPSAQPNTSGAPALSPVSASPSSPAQGSSHAAPAGPQPCASRDLSVRTGQGQGAAGSTYVLILFTNNSNATCTLYGYPGVALAGGSPVRQIGAAADENQATPRQVVTLSPGAVASAQLRIVSAQNFPAARCNQVPARYLQVYPPNQTAPIYVMYSSTACSKPVHLLTVDVVKAGTGG